MAPRWTNADGLQVPFGNYWADPSNFVNRAWTLSTMGAVKQLEIDFDLSRIPTGTTSFSTDLNNDGTVGKYNRRGELIIGASMARRLTCGIAVD